MSTPYSPDLNALIVGPSPITGFAEDSAIEVKFDEERVKQKIGQDGHDVQSYNPASKAGTITIKLMQDSPSNQYLTALAAELGPVRIQYFPVLLQDLNGASRASGMFYVKKVPDAAFGKEIGEREWVLASGRMTHNVAGIPVAF
jgi:hypothetical protein